MPLPRWDLRLRFCLRLRLTGRSEYAMPHGPPHISRLPAVPMGGHACCASFGRKNVLWY